MKGGQIRPMSGAMVEGSRGDCDQAALYLTAHADLPCNRIIFARSGKRAEECAGPVYQSHSGSYWLTGSHMS